MPSCRDHGSELVEISERFKSFLKKIGYSQQRLADEVGVDKGTISNYANAKSFPGKKVLGFLVEKFQLNTNWLIQGEGPDRLPYAPAIHREEQAEYRVEPRDDDYLAEKAKQEYLDRLGELLIHYGATEEQIAWVNERVEAKEKSSKFWKLKTELLAVYPERIRKRGMTERMVVPMILASYKTEDEIKKGATG